MAGIDEVLERLVADADFRAALARDPATTLAGYDLTRDDVELLAGRLDDGDDAERTVEQRTSKSAMLALLASFTGAGGSAAGPGRRGEQIEVLSISHGSGEGDDAAPDGLSVPGGGEDAPHEESKGEVEVSWKIEQGQKVEIDPNALSGDPAPGAPSTDDEGIIVINGLEDGGTEMEDVEPAYGKVEYEAQPLDPALADPGSEPEDAGAAFLKIGDIKGEAPQPAASPPGNTAAGVAPPDDGVVGGIPPDDSLEGVAPPDNGVVGSNPPDDSLAGGNPPDDGDVGSNPPDDGLAGGTPPDDGLAGATPLEDGAGARTDVAAADVDDVMEIEDM